MTSSQDQRNSAFGGRQLDAEWQEVLLQARDKPWLLRLLAAHGTAIVARYALWKQRLARLRTGERRRLRQRLGVGVAGAALILALTASPGLGAPAAAISVDQTSGVIAVDGTCSLAEAINNANGDSQYSAVAGECAAGSGADILSITTNIGLTAALPAITTAITIEGGGNTIAGNNFFRILNVTSSGNLTLNSATISFGYANYGGGIYNRGTVTVQSSTLSANLARFGGGIFNRGTLTVQNSTISANSACWNGGGIFNYYGTLTVEDSTLSANSARYGGGIYNGDYGAMTVQNSTLSANSARYSGGGIDNRSTLTVQNSTISANSAYWNGGGIYNNRGTLTVQNSTLSANSASVYGGGIRKFNGAVTVQNSIVALQTAGGDCSGSITTGGYNIDSDSSCGFAGTSDQQGVTSGNLKLGALANNGGPTQTMALASGSVAINQIPTTDATCNPGSSTDQRGSPRAGGEGTNQGGSACDVGAYELQSGTSPTAVTLRDFTAASASGGGLAGWAAATLAALGLGAVIVRRRRRNDDGLGQSGRSPLAQTDAESDPGRWPYQPPAIVHRGMLELRAGSPLALPEFMDPDNPLP